ncbi:flagellar export protein FliJ [Evansella sp. LMS18]|uniref:flagellar export protein FliJ n=1 Tax=Evansella sp. LMS18 TaxID=2924033 RepID=UPI0020D086F3|nr:flagellar export protein FliJ [Evansella sp. LMS18]UTR10866.1 flagellar export protein FliJ [Evansella sp. LMS18]
MGFQYTLQKVLEVKEHEQAEAQAAYEQAIKQFEETATELYHLLKQKEDMLASYEDKLSGGIPVATIQYIQESLRFMQQRIDKLQIDTQRARDLMNKKQIRLNITAVDVRKFEKMKEKKYEAFIEEAKKQENQFLDEISVQKFSK